MRIAVVHSFYQSAQPSGENAVVAAQAAALEDAGHDVLLISRHTDDQQARRLYPLAAAGAAALGTGASPARELNGFQPDVIHLHNTFPNFGTRFLNEWGSRTVTTLHNYRTICAAGTLFRDGSDCRQCISTPAAPAILHACYRSSRPATLPLAIGTAPGGGMRRILARSAHLVTLNETARAVFSAVTDTAITLVPNFVDVVEATSLRRQSWAYVGRVTPEKGLSKLLEHWPVDQELEIIGDGPDRQKLQRQWRNCKNISWHGMLDHRALRIRLGTYAGLVIPSLWTEGLPTVALEALAAGTPLVCSDRIAATPELVSLGVAADFTFEPHRLNLTQALDRVSAQLNNMSSRAKLVHAERYSRQSWLQRMEPIYELVRLRNSPH